MRALEILETIWPPLAAVLTLLVSVLSSAHAVLRKRDNRAAVGWVGLIWLVPVLGASLYLLLGINRIRRRAHALRPGRSPPAREVEHACDPGKLAALHPGAAALEGLARVGDRVLGRPLLEGNVVRPLDGGAAAYGEMLEAIDGAKRSVALCTYIFDDDAAGERFVRALIAAKDRGVEVRVLIDGVGVRYGTPPVHRRLQRAGVRAALYLPTMVPAFFPYFNLRNHRKLLIVDGTLGFTGGMNIREEFARKENAARDLHFRLEGPVIAHLRACFAADWAFAAREQLTGETWFPTLLPVGPIVARGIPHGPDEHFDHLRSLLLGAVSSARKSVRIITPYFLPDAALVTTLNVAALRGVNVEILIPQKGNLALVQWASTAQLWQSVERGCEVRLGPPPFDHTKLVVIDELWSLIGSANWDPRSLRLNFEFNVECYDPLFARELVQLFEERARHAHRVTLQELDGRPLSIKLRDGLARLCSPYL